MTLEPPGSDTSERILDCARRLYLEEGLGALSMRRVARCAGVSATAIYRHYEGKNDLLTAVAEAGHAAFGRRIGSALDGDTPLERLRLTSEGYRQFAVEQSQDYRVLFLAPGVGLAFDELPEANRQRLGATFLFLVDRVRECQEVGAFCAGDPASMATSLWAQMHGLVSLYLLGQWPGSEADFVAFYRSSVQALTAALSTS